MVTTTVASAADAQRLAAGAVGERLAACVQVEQIASHYVWKGRPHDEAEWRLACKTTAHAAPALCAWLRAQHPYEVPQLLAQPVQASEDYAQWVTEQVQAAPGD
ncbi:uncharacterized protein involved in tolerance to divalent cations [Melaminivora alkalimesophila]|uniref:Uncharacterized protein involved in tolerance to divalent cations n=2 Tax=Melaminivora alkalimesophila TaxID=1165852 RepID=A0A317REA6_9BURK|nr:uncharacterized protein involved in tolerance to divalent cations [Melaminivora alkalimesophila]